jgi:peptide/nickel transport system ATP-binding protein
MTLRIRDLALHRQDGPRLLHLPGLDLGLGERLGLVGESGSGKSLLAQAIFGTLPAGVAQTEGFISAFGVRMDLPGPAREGIRGRRLAWVPQDPAQALHPFLRVQDQLALLPGVHLREGRRGALARLEPLLERLGLPRTPVFLRSFPAELSGGQRQRVALAQALSCDPDLLVLDEPTSALDATVQADFVHLLDGLQAERGLGWLWITHDLGVAAAVADRLIVLYGGEVLEAGPTRPILRNPRHPYSARLLSAARAEPSREGGFLDAPERRPPGCPFQPRCGSAASLCARWGPWRGALGEGFRCEHPLVKP